MSKFYKPKEFGAIINRSVITLQGWDREGKLIAHRTPTNRRYYTHDQYLQYIGLQATIDKAIVVYARVSSASQKDDLIRQTAALEQYTVATGYAVTEWINEVGSGLNYTRKKFNTLLKDVEMGQVAKIIIAHKDRLIRFGFEWFEDFCQRHGTQVEVMNHASLSPEQEMTPDLLAIIHCFSSRLYGLRKYKKELLTQINEKELLK
jgi:putative resolvase